MRRYGEKGGPLRAELNTLFGSFFSGVCPHGAGFHTLRNFSGISVQMPLRAVGVALPGCVRAVQLVRARVFLLSQGALRNFYSTHSALQGRLHFQRFRRELFSGRQDLSGPSPPEDLFCGLGFVGRTASYSTSKIPFFYCDESP